MSRTVSLLSLLFAVVLLNRPDPARTEPDRRAPSSPLNLTVKNITSTEIHLTWTKPAVSTFPPPEIVQVAEESEGATRRRKRTKAEDPDEGRSNETSPSLVYVLYYEEGSAGDEPDEWKGESVESRPEIQSRVESVNLVHNTKDNRDSKGVGYTLKRLKSYTRYRIWVRAFFGHFPETSSKQLSPRSTRISCTTDVPPPSVPILMNLTCDQPPGTLSVGWIQPEVYTKNVSLYTVTLRRLEPSRDVQTFPVETRASHIETNILLEVVILNNQSTYEITMYASSPSIVKDGLLINGTKTEPRYVVMTPDCVPIVPVKEASNAPLLKIIFLLLTLIFGIVLILLVLYYKGCVTVFKKCYPMSYLFLEEGVTIGGDGCGENGTLGKTESQINCSNKKIVTSPEHALVFWGAAKNKNSIESNSEQLWDPLHPPVAADKFFAHTAALHADGDIGFSKEYELIQSKSAMLSHTSHHSHHPDNRHKNRYLNITAYDHSRVCLLPSSSCLCEPGKEHRKSCTTKPNSPPVDSPSHCDYVNANFIDGIVAEIDSELAKYIVEQNNKRKAINKIKQEAADSLTTASQPTSELWISVDESQRPFNYMCAKTINNDNADTTASLTSETKNLLSEKSMQNSYTNAIKGKLSLDLDKKEERKALTPNSEILANTCRLSINLDRKDEKLDEFKTEKVMKESKSKKRSTSADTRDIIVDKKSSSRGHSKNSSVVGTANDNSPSNTAPKIEGAFLNIEFSGIVDSERELQKAKEAEKLNEINKLAKENAEETLEDLDDLYVQVDGESYRVNSSWLLDRRRYIGTQGPTPGTLPAFWRMVWDHQVVVIVMITNLVERGRRKCDMYWPKEGSEVYGAIQVNTTKEDVMATYTVRTFQIKNTKSGLSRQVLQYHYTVWPDHGTPEHPLAVLRFREAARKAVPPQAGAVLVHCSAGVGRTGTYIVLDAMLNHLRLTGSLNVFGFLCHVRSQRNFLVQTEEQYVFIHDALLEAIQSGDTEVPVENAKQYLRKLLEPFPEGYVSNFLSNSKCGPYGAPLLEKPNEYKIIDNFAPILYGGKIKRINSGECDFNIWNNTGNAQFSNDKTLDECRNDIVSVALQEAKSIIECNGNIINDTSTSPKNEKIKLLNGNPEDSNEMNDFDETVDAKTFDNNSELLLDDTKEDKAVLSFEDNNICNKLKAETVSDKIETTSINSVNLAKSDHSTSYEKINGLCAKVSEESKASSVSNDDMELLSNENNSNGLPNNGNKNDDANPSIPFNADNSNTITSSISSDTNNINNDGSLKEKRSSNFSPNQYGSNQENGDNSRKDINYSLSRNKNYDNYELLGGSGRPGGLGGASVDCFAGSHRFACQKKDTSGKKPKNLLEHQFKLITSFEPSKFHTVNASKQVNLPKNRRGCVLPIESGRVHLIPKPGIEGSDYINATWLQGHRSLKEYVVTQHPLPATVGDLYRMLWDHSCQILVVLSNCSYDPECKPFWPTEKHPEVSTYNFNIRFLSEEKHVAKRISLCDLNNKKNLHKLLEDDSSQESPLQSPSSLSSNKEFSLKLTKGSQRPSPTSSNSEHRKSSQYSPKETVETNGRHLDDNSDMNFYKQQCSSDNQDEERLIPKSDESNLECPEELDELKKLNIDTKLEGYTFDKTELRIETMSNNEVKSGKSSPLKQEVNGEPFTPNEDVSKKSQTKSPSKISLKSLRINSPILKSPSKFKFDFGNKNKVEEGRKSPQSTTDNTLSFDPKYVMVPLVHMSQLREGSEEIGLDCVITTTNISINSLQDDYELKVKLIECPRWLGDLDYDENSDTDEDSEDEEYEMEEKALDYVIDQRLRAYKGVYGLPEFVTRCQDDAKNSPVVVVDKTGGARAVALCTLTGVLRRQSRDLYSLAKLHHGRRAGAWRRPSDIRALYEALAAYEHPPPPTVSTQS